MTPLFNPVPEVSLAMLRQVVGLVRKLGSAIGGFAGLTSDASDPTCAHLAGLNSRPPLVRGFVTRTGIGSYDCEVRIVGGDSIVCSVLSPVVHDLYGVSQSCMPVPGSQVLVFAPNVGLNKEYTSPGYVLGVIPKNRSGALKEKIGRLGDIDFPEGGVAQTTEGGPAAIAADKSYITHADYQCGRLHDLVPGEYALTNHAGAGMVIGALSTTIKGSEAASVRCSSLDDQVRVVSRHFKHISAAGSEEIFNDGGFISVESSVSMYQPERMGVKQFRQDNFGWNTVSLKGAQERNSGVNTLEDGQTSKKRFYRYSGYLGDIINVFVASPDPDGEVETMSNNTVDQGLFHAHVDTSGRMTVRSAAGIMFERYDRIPIPKRRHYAWDPSGCKADSSTIEEKKRFQVTNSAQYPMGIGLTLGDMSAWWNHLSYLRFEQFKGDFSIPEQTDLKPPEDEYDRLGKGKESFQDHDRRHSYIGLTPDGGIVLRDAWGSEIVMADGRITLNAAANIEIRSGSSVIIMGGDDVITKAYNSVDISSTNKDVRIKAENNMQLVSLQRGILIQSKGDDKSSIAWGKTGEDLESTGVVIKSDKSSVALIGNRTTVQGINEVSLSSFNQKGKPSGNVTLVGKTVSTVAEGNVTLTSKGTSGLLIGEQSAILCAPSVMAVGGQSDTNSSGDSMMLGIPVKIGNPYASTVSIFSSQSKKYLDNIEWLNPMSPKDFSSVTFRFRTSKQYATASSDSGISGKTFSVYQPSWAVLASAGRDWMKSCKLKAWEEKSDKGASGSSGETPQYPWPGADAMANSYITYQEKNVIGSGEEKPKTDTTVLTPTSFSRYHIRDIETKG